MEWISWLSLIIICYSLYSRKVKKLERKVKRLERNQKEGLKMSKIISDLIGKNCKIKAEDALLFSGNTEVTCTVLDADDEWIKFTYTDKKNIVKTKVLRIESIESVELVNE